MSPPNQKGRNQLQGEPRQAGGNAGGGEARLSGAASRADGQGSQRSQVLGESMSANVVTGKADGNPMKYDGNSSENNSSRDWRNRGGGGGGGGLQERPMNMADESLVQRLGDDLETLFEVRCVLSYYYCAVVSLGHCCCTVCCCAHPDLLGLYPPACRCPRIFCLYYSTVPTDYCTTDCCTSTLLHFVL